MSSPLPQAISEALAATELFIAALEKENLSGWAVRFSEIAQCLVRNDIKTAVSKYSACSYTGPGSLSDILHQMKAIFINAGANAEKHCAFSKGTPNNALKSFASLSGTACRSPLT